MGLLNRLLHPSSGGDGGGTTSGANVNCEWIPDAIEFSPTTDGDDGSMSATSAFMDSSNWSGSGNKNIPPATAPAAKQSSRTNTTNSFSPSFRTISIKETKATSGGRPKQTTPVIMNNNNSGTSSNVQSRDLDATMADLASKISNIDNTTSKFDSNDSSSDSSYNSSDNNNEQQRRRRLSGIAEDAEEEYNYKDNNYHQRQQQQQQQRQSRGAASAASNTNMNRTASSRKKEGNGDDKRKKKIPLKLGKLFGGSSGSSSSNKKYQNKGYNNKNKNTKELHEMDDDDDDYISGEDDDGDDDDSEFDSEFTNSDGYIVRPAAAAAATATILAARKGKTTTLPRGGGGGGGIGVPNSQGNLMTPARLEDELYLYKLETLHLTDTCTELSNQLDEVEQRLGHVQAQATFRIHALEAELQDGNLGLRSLVKMTSTEMDSRLDALRALGRTVTVQSARLKEREHEIHGLEGRLRRTRRDVTKLKRENSKINTDKMYLKERLDELDQLRYQLEEELQILAMENNESTTTDNRSREMIDEEITKVKFELQDTLAQIGIMSSQLEEKDMEIMKLHGTAECKEVELHELREDVMKKEQQLLKVRTDLLEAANAAQAAEMGRVEALAREGQLSTRLDETIVLMNEVQSKVDKLEGREVELQCQLDTAQIMSKEVAQLEELRVQLTKLESEVQTLQQDKANILTVMNETQLSHTDTIANRDEQIATLNQDVDVHREQYELAVSMIEEREQLAIELRYQLATCMKESEMSISELQEQLAVKCREVKNISTELEERNGYVATLENKLVTMKMEFMKHRTELENAKLASIAEDDGEADSQLDEFDMLERELEEHESMTVSPPHSTQARDHADKEATIDRLEHELGVRKRQVEQLSVELEEKDKHVNRLKVELDLRKGRVDEVEAQLDERDKTIKSLNSELTAERESLVTIEAKLQCLQQDLTVAKDNVNTANMACHEAETKMLHEVKLLKSHVESLQKENDIAMAETQQIKDEAEKEKKLSIQAAATLAVSNSAQQAEMDMSIDRLKKEMEAKACELEAIQATIIEKDELAEKLSTALAEAREDLLNYKESVFAEREAHALESVTQSSFCFDVNDDTTKDNNPAGSTPGRFGGLFNRGKSTGIDRDQDGGDSVVDWKVIATEKDKRITSLESALAENAISIGALKAEFTAASSKFNEDEIQRRLLIQRLEHENSAYLLKINVLEEQFDNMRKKKDAEYIIKRGKSAEEEDGSVASSMCSGMTRSTAGSEGVTIMTGVTSITGKSKLTPLERDNKKLKKQKKVYETRISSLQSQLSDIQQIVPELMSKSKSQIQKLEMVVETQRKVAQEKEESLNAEIAQLREQNEQLAAATRSRLQENNAGQQEEIEQLKLRLEVREATIKKLEMMNGSSKMGRLRKKKKKVPGGGDSDCGSSVTSTTTDL